MRSNRINIVELQDSLHRPLVLDGAMGSQLIKRNVPSDKYLWSSLANITHTDEVRKLHKDYISAGADIITTNTFRTNPAALKKSSYHFSVEELVKAGTKAAFDASENESIIIAGSNAPAEDCYQKQRTLSKYELEYNHKKHIELLWENGCDIIWNETQSHMDEIELICDFCSSNKIPFTINLFFTGQLNLLCGTRLSDTVKIVSGYSPTAIGFNCMKSEMFFNYLNNNSTTERWGFYFNCGGGNVIDEVLNGEIEPGKYIESIQPLFKLNPLFIGSCCGSSPSHTKAIKEALDEIYRN